MEKAVAIDAQDEIIHDRGEQFGSLSMRVAICGLRLFLNATKWTLVHRMEQNEAAVLDSLV